jgi:hypothetical protein
MSGRDILSLFVVRWLLPAIGASLVVFVMIRIVRALDR